MDVALFHEGILSGKWLFSVDYTTANKTRYCQRIVIDQPVWRKNPQSFGRVDEMGMLLMGNFDLFCMMY